MAPIRVLPAASSLEHRLRQYAGSQDPTKHGSYLGRVTLFRVTEPWKEGGRDPHLGWDGVAAGGVEVYEVPGDRFTSSKSHTFKCLPHS